MNRRDRHASIRRSPLATLMDERQAVTATNIEIDKDAKPSASIPNRIHGAFRTMTNGQFHPLVDHRERELHCMRNDRLRFDQQNRSRLIQVVHRFLIHGSGVFLDGGHIVQPCHDNHLKTTSAHRMVTTTEWKKRFDSSIGVRIAWRLDGKSPQPAYRRARRKRRNKDRRKRGRASVAPLTMAGAKNYCKPQTDLRPATSCCAARLERHFAGERRGPGDAGRTRRRCRSGAAQKKKAPS